LRIKSKINRFTPKQIYLKKASGVIPKGFRRQGFKGLSKMLKIYRDLKVWQKLYELLEIYGITAKFPKKEKYVLIS